jgi:hypothetical protein
MSAKFHGLLRTEGVPPYSRVWRVLEDLKYTDRNGKEWIIPRELLFDKFSSPRFGWWALPPSLGHRDRAAALHDLMVRCREIFGITLMDCHMHFRDAMECVGFPMFQRWYYYSKVVAFNWLCAGDGKGFHYKDRYNSKEFVDSFNRAYKGKYEISFNEWKEKMI